MDSQEAEVKIRFVIDASGAKVVNALTGEVLKLATAEETARDRVEAYTKAAKERANVGMPSPGAAPTAPATGSAVAPAVPAVPRQIGETPARERLTADALQESRMKRVSPIERRAALLTEVHDLARDSSIIQPPQPRLMDRVGMLGGTQNQTRVPSGIGPAQAERMNRMGDQRPPERAEAEMKNEMARLTREIARLYPEIRRLAESFGGAGGGTASRQIGTSTAPAERKPEPTLRERVAGQFHQERDQRDFQREYRRQAVTGEAGFRPQAMALGGVAMGALGAGMGILGAAGDYSRQQNEINRRIFMSRGDRDVQRQESIPILGWAARQGREIGKEITGQPEKFRKFEEDAFRREMDSIRERGGDVAYTSRFIEMAKVKSRGEAESTRLPQTMNREPLDTLSSERARRESLVMQPMRERREDARIDYESADKELQMLEHHRGASERIAKEKEKKLADLVAIYKQEERLAAEKGTADTGMMFKTGKEIATTRDELVAENERTQRIREQLKAAATNREITRSQLSKYDVDGAEFRQAGMAIWQEREQRAVSQATTLGMAGPEQRAMSQQAFQAVKNVGIENAPQELISQASALFGEEIRKMAERAGSKMMPDFKRAAPEEYKYGVDESRSAIEEIRVDIQKAAAINTKELAGKLQSVLDGYTQKILTGVIEMLGNKYRNEDILQMIKNSSANQ